MQLTKYFFYLCLIFYSAQNVADNTRRIIGGRDAIKGNWSWMVSINNRYGVHCGGSLIAPHWIISAAHCFDGIINPQQELSIYLNFIDQQNLSNAEQHTIHDVFVHPQWDTYNLDSPYDIALIQLSEPSPQPPIYPNIDLKSHTKVGDFSKALGWGTTNIHTFASSRYLQEVQLPIVSLPLCQAAYAGTYKLFAGQLCAGYDVGGKDGCAGDSGAPLIQHDGTDWRLLGLSSFGGTYQIPCGGEGLYGIYSNVHYYRDFVRQYLYQDLKFEHDPSFKVGDMLNISIKEQRNIPRNPVDLWVLLENIDTQNYYFISGSATAPIFSLEQQIWQPQISVEQTQHTLLSIPTPAGVAANYRLYAVYVDSGHLFEPRYQRSEIAISPFQITD